MNRRYLIKKSATFAIITPSLLSSLISVNGQDSSGSTSSSTDPCATRDTATRPDENSQWTCLAKDKTILGWCWTLPKKV